MEIFLYILLIILIILFIVELSTIMTYGWFIPKKIQSIYMDLDENKLYLNRYNPKILMLQHSFISNTQSSIFSKYYISGVGVVPRWSKLHKQINHYYEVALKKSL